jgi:hypothetical protein
MSDAITFEKTFRPLPNPQNNSKLAKSGDGNAPILDLFLGVS